MGFSKLSTLTPQNVGKICTQVCMYVIIVLIVKVFVNAFSDNKRAQKMYVFY